jgi:endonuclease/exonuclease/phosphatase family metal-dependent hydrolase
MRLVDGLEPPIVIGGDLNEFPDGPAARILAGLGWDAWTRIGFSTGETYPASDPSARIDYLFTSREVRVERAMVPKSAMIRTASDHLPVVVDLDL